ncbi:aminotransferase class I/II-fold pyridoxal phosphate-dependent enzyme [Curtobacterium sp. MCPF17_052]|uniref:aminotransferase class I/II-fold pyridoxal phosphate-dependent enzyme n=1 Tax=Curtobacterium sp. MCPF17_052 TaxID=2175655 RepID=UPI0024DFDCF8|nr:aminotransferase class I/II-fold pyridoxal phosphate-dependent enzyme [Curtobacterium sp. MCPF17_052]WIB11886.1 aminotransferase class I/II-fold pyridoxal phosphate-dependent enzyme [Curtobacterium sp. MCPF17_052]
MTPVLLSARSVAQLLRHWRSGSDAAAYEALADAVRVLVIDGRIPHGARLPAERGLAAALGVSRTTVANAYARLREDGYLTSLRGSGSIIRLPLEGRPDPEHLAGTVPADLLDLRKAALRSAPGVADAVERAMRHLPAALAGIGYDTVGDAGLRAAIADRYTARGLPTTASEVIVTIGAQHAIALLARVLVRRGDPVLVESPTYPHAHEVLREAGGRLVSVPVDVRGGWDEGGARRDHPAVGADARVPDAGTAQPDRCDDGRLDPPGAARGRRGGRHGRRRGRDDGGSCASTASPLDPSPPTHPARWSWSVPPPRSSGAGCGSAGSEPPRSSCSGCSSPAPPVTSARRSSTSSWRASWSRRPRPSWRPGGTSSATVATVSWPRSGHDCRSGTCRHRRAG